MGIKTYEKPEYFTNRELSWLEFNYRVLSEAKDKTIPLLERLKFLSITASNLDEFFMIRVASLKDMVNANYKKEDIAGLTPIQQLAQISLKTHALVQSQYSTFNRSFLPQLKQNKIHLITHYERLSKEQERFIDKYFLREVYPVLTPMAVDSSRPFPLIRNKTLNIGALIKKHALLENNLQTIKKEFNPNKKIPLNTKKEFNVGYLFLESLYNSLKIKDICDEISEKYKYKFNLNEILSYLTYARIIYPSSKLETFKQCKGFIEQPKFSLHDEYRSLSYIAENLDFIQEKLFENSKNIIKRNSEIIYYDCTNYFFEIDLDDDLRKYGISKEHRPNPIVGMGLFMDGDGLPLSFNIYPGNQNEQKTLIPEESKIVDSFKMDDTKIILCTDAGLASDEIKKYNIKDGRGFVITQSLKKLKTDYLNQVYNASDWRIAGDLKNIFNLNDIKNNDELKEKYYNTLFYKIIQTETKSIKQDLIVTFCFKYFDYNRNIRNSQIERAKRSIDSNQSLKKGKNQNDYKRFINNTKSTDNGEIAENDNLSLDEELIKNEEKYDGYYALTTNLVGDIEQILKISKGRWEIEESFRIMKTDFLARPVNLSREDRIKAHFMTCFISLLIYRLLEKKLDYKYTTSQILTTLRNMNMLEHKGLGYEPIYERTKITDELHEVFKFNTDNEIITYKKIKNILYKI